MAQIATGSGIRITNKTTQDFLSEEWSKKLSELIDMSDSKYAIKGGFICLKEDIEPPFISTYTLPELLYKLGEYVEIDTKWCDLKFCKDAPFYCFYYHNRDSNEDMLGEFFDYPIESAAYLLLQCVKKKVGYVKDVSSK